MASLDPASITSSAEVFSSSHTLPQIRSLHRNIHVQIDEKATRLRTQVGGSYRELLGTADSIVRMRGDNEAVQEVLGKMGGRCGRAVVGGKARGLGNFVEREQRPAMAKSARLQLLDKCGLMAGRILKGGGGLSATATRGDRLLLASKILVLIRLLIKRLGDEENDQQTRHVLDLANKTHSDLRRRLRVAIDGVLEQEEGDNEREDILKALCAYSLVSSSGSRDVLRYFLDVRAGAIALSFDTDELEREPRTEEVIRSLKLYTRSLLDVQAIVPDRLSQALNGLKSKPLLADSSIKQLEGLRLEVYERWCGEEIQYFVPFIRHDDLDGTQARDMLNGWGKKGGNVLLDGLKKTLDHLNEFKTIMELRTGVLQLWIRDGNRAKGFDSEAMQDNLRKAINARMLSVLESKVHKLRLVGSEVNATVENWEHGATDKCPGLWDDSGYDEALASGAAPFIQEVVGRLYGRSDAVSRAGTCYTSWYHVIDDVKDVVKLLTNQRWDNDYDEVEDEETIEARQQVLSKDDPKLLQDKLDMTLDKAFEDLHEQLQQLWNGRAKDKTSAAVAMYMLRVVRDIRRQIPERPAIQRFGLSIVPSLHSSVAESISASSEHDFETSGLAERTVVGRPLWEGEPALPSQPSPQVFLFLRDLSQAMADAGMDIWTSAAVAVMKKHLDDRLSGLWAAASEAAASESPDRSAEKKEETSESGESEETKENGVDGEESKKKTPEEQRRELYVQWLFDVSYMRSCTTSINNSGEKEDHLLKVEDALWEKSELEKSHRERITKSARDYWQRTSLLFGLLA